MNQNILKSLLIVIIALCVLGFGVYGFLYSNKGTDTTLTMASDVKNNTYTIDRETFTLRDGTVTKDSAPGSTVKTTVSIFGEPMYGDLNGDTINDAALLLQSDGGGSGTFYYAVLAIASGTSYIPTNSLFLGDRIAPQNIAIINGRAVFNYTERRAGEPMTTPPSVGRSLAIYYDKKINEIGELVQNFEGEADPSRMSLAMKKWTWLKTQMNDGKQTSPNKADAFTLTFSEGKALLTTDCNQMSAEYTVNKNELTFGPIVSTKMFCENSQEQEFANSLTNVGSYLFTSKGELILEIKMDSGSMTFR